MTAKEEICNERYIMLEMSECLRKLRMVEVETQSAGGGLAGNAGENQAGRRGCKKKSVHRQLYCIGMPGIFGG